MATKIAKSDYLALIIGAGFEFIVFLISDSVSTSKNTSETYICTSRPNLVELRD